MTSAIPQSVSENFEAVVKALDWKVFISSALKTSGHIKRLELEAALLAARHMGHSLTARGCLVSILVDRKAELGAMTEGRSSSTSMNRFCRRLEATLLTNDVSLIHLWIPSEPNPTDAPSRASFSRSPCLRHNYRRGVGTS